MQWLGRAGNIYNGRSVRPGKTCNGQVGQVRPVMVSQFGEYSVMWINKIWCMRIQVNKITQLISSHLLKVQTKKYFKSVLTPYRLATFLGQTWKIEYPTKRTPERCWLNSAFPFILYLWIRIRIHGPKWIRIQPDPDPHPWNIDTQFLEFFQGWGSNPDYLNPRILFMWLKRILSVHFQKNWHSVAFLTPIKYFHKYFYFCK